MTVQSIIAYVRHSSLHPLDRYWTFLNIEVELQKLSLGWRLEIELFRNGFPEALRIVDGLFVHFLVLFHRLNVCNALYASSWRVHRVGILHWIASGWMNERIATSEPTTNSRTPLSGPIKQLAPRYRNCKCPNGYGWWYGLQAGALEVSVPIVPSFEYQNPQMSEYSESQDLSYLNSFLSAFQKFYVGLTNLWTELLFYKISRSYARNIFRGPTHYTKVYPEPFRALGLHHQRLYLGSIYRSQSPTLIGQFNNAVFWCLEHFLQII